MRKSLLFTFYVVLATCLVLGQAGSNRRKGKKSTQRVLEENSSYNLVDTEEGDGTYHYTLKYQGSLEQWSTSKIIKNLLLTVDYRSPNVLNVKLTDIDSQRWELPQEEPFPHFKQEEKSINKDESNFIVEVESTPFTIVIKRRDTGEIIFDTRGKPFIYSNFYIELGTTLPSDNVYGFGERNYKFKMTRGTYSIWPRDDPKILEEGVPGGNTYGHHPVGLIKEKSGNFFLTYMRNSNAMDVIITEEPSLTYKMIGGVIDLVFFIGDKYPDTVLKAYHNYLGNFTMMPFWSMGFHQSKWGYGTYEIMLDIVTKYKDNDIPLDVIWSDIDYMIEKEIFTMDTYRYPPQKMKTMFETYNKSWVPIIDPGVKKNNARGPGAIRGLEQDIFIKNSRGDDLVGSVWPGDVYFPDFFNPKTESYWHDMLDVLYGLVAFNGIWLDMNEIANFVDGDVERHYAGEYQDVPYNVGDFPLQRKTISLDAKHHGGIIEFNVHSQYALVENKATHSFLKTKSALPFILTRANSPGIGKYSAHWTGDNGAHWEYLKYSISGNFNYQIFGAPFVGADICGFMDSTTDELCARWTQLGALYPFARNHHEDRTRNQEPWTFQYNNEGVTVLQTARIALKTRYSLLKWYYSLFIETGGAGSVFKPLFFEFPSEEALFKDDPDFADTQLLLGKGVMCTPQVEPRQTQRQAHFPKAIWYNLFTGEQIIGEVEENRVLTVKTPYDAPVPHFLRGGHIVHQQNVKHVLSTKELNDEFELIIGFDQGGSDAQSQARGSLMGIQSFDDDSVLDRCMNDNCLYNLVATIKNQNTASVTIEITVNRQIENPDSPFDDFALTGLKLYGLDLSFFEEDERKVGYAFAQVINEIDGTQFSSSYQMTPLTAAGAFKIEFNEVIRLQDESTFRIDIMI